MRCCTKNSLSPFTIQGRKVVIDKYPTNDSLHTVFVAQIVAVNDKLHRIAQHLGHSRLPDHKHLQSSIWSQQPKFYNLARTCIRSTTAVRSMRYTVPHQPCAQAMANDAILFI